MLSLEEARHQLLARILPLPAESIPLADAHRRLLAQDLLAPRDLPHFDNSSMDGFAVQAADTASASPDVPVLLRLAGRLPAGATTAQPLAQGECVRVFTGSTLPPGADAVVIQEDTRPDADDPASIAILEPVKPWANIRFRGEDLKQGAPLLHAGQRLGPQHLALLGALGLDSVSVHRPPRVGVLATGSELVEPGQALPPGHLYESNRVMIATLARAAGAIPRIHPLVPDSLEATQAALAAGFQDADALITSGGVSVGELDFLKEAFQALGGRTEFWKVAMRPGKPFVFGRWGDRYWFGLPGNPVSALVTFAVLVRPALLRMQGASHLELPQVPGVLAHPIENRGDRRHFVRVRLDAQGQVHSTGVQASHILSSLAAAQGLVDIPPRTSWPAGQPVHILWLDS